MKLQLQPITWREAKAFIEAHHRHHKAPQGWLFGCAVNDGDQVVGVVMVGRPVSRLRDDGYTAEVTRLCVLDGYPNACSMLYAAAWRAARALGYQRIGAYLLESEGGASVRAAGWREVAKTKGGSWDRPSRPRVDSAPIVRKTLFEMSNT